MRQGFDRFTVVLAACVLFPMFTRDVLPTPADHGFYNPKWSDRIHAEWTANLVSRLATGVAPPDPGARVDAVRHVMDRAFPDALVRHVPPARERCYRWIRRIGTWSWQRLPPWAVDELIERETRASLLETAAWLEGEDVRRLL